MSRPYRFKVKGTIEGQRFEPVFLVRSISQKQLEGLSLNLCQMFTSSKNPCLHYTGLRSRLCLKVKGLSHGMFIYDIDITIGGDIRFCVKNNSSYLIVELCELN